MMIDQAAATKICRDIERKMAAQPVEVLQKVRHQQEIEAWNAAVDAKKAAKKAKKQEKLS